MGSGITGWRARGLAARADLDRVWAESRGLVAEIEAGLRRVRAAADLLSSTRAHGWRPAPPVPPPGGPGGPAAQDPLRAALHAAGLREDDLGDITDALIAAYLKAEATGDEEMRAALGDLLRQIGRHLAIGLGPRAAGVVLN